MLTSCVATAKMTKASDADGDDIELQMPNDLAQQINDCISKYNDTNGDS